jgi:pimeloyl-ACP methyl ester carboxylesterase
VIELAGAAHPAGVTLLGHSYGGLIALTLTRRLEGAALEPARLVLYEPPLALDCLAVRPGPSSPGPWPPVTWTGPSPSGCASSSGCRARPSRPCAGAVPVLLLLGQLSPPWLTAASRRLAQFLPDVTVAELPGQAHDAHIFAAAVVAGQIARFALAAPPAL